MASALSRAVRTTAPHSGVSDGRRRDRPLGPARSHGPIGELQRAAGNRRIAQLLGGRATEPRLQRALKVGDGKTLTRDSHQTDRRELMNEVDKVLKEKHFVATNAAYRLLVELINDEGPRPFLFSTYDEVVDVLFKREMLYKPTRGGSLGPTTLGDRPRFYGDAAKLPAGKGEARRHVISSSALGRAIESAIAPYAKADIGKQELERAYRNVCAFLSRFGGQVPKGECSTGNLHAAARCAWELVHNHSGNLWLGSGTENSVLGFIRGAFHAERMRLTLTEDKQPDACVSVQAVFDNVKAPAGPGMQRKDAGTVWEEIIKEFKLVLDFHADKHLGKHPMERGKVDVAVARQLTEEFELNADLDLPQMNQKQLAEHGMYLTTVIELHSALVRKPSLEIFDPGGALSRFMELRVNPFVQGAKKQ